MQFKVTPFKAFLFAAIALQLVSAASIPGNNKGSILNCKFATLSYYNHVSSARGVADRPTDEVA
jgi:hypothetical protein